MSIQSQIERITKNVSNAQQALREKGVEVPSGANSDSLADNIRAINVSEEVNLDEEISAQDSLIAQIQTELAGKVNPPSGTSIETCTVVLPNTSDTRYSSFVLTILSDGVITSLTPDINERTIENVVCGSQLFFEKDMGSADPSNYLLDGEECYFSYGTTYSIFVVPYKNGETIYLRSA